MVLLQFALADFSGREWLAVGGQRVWEICETRSVIDSGNLFDGLLCMLRRTLGVLRRTLDPLSSRNAPTAIACLLQSGSSSLPFHSGSVYAIRQFAPGTREVQKTEKEPPADQGGIKPGAWGKIDRKGRGV